MGLEDAIHFLHKRKQVHLLFVPLPELIAHLEPFNGSGSFEGGYNTPFDQGFLNRQLYNRPSGMSLFIPGPSAVNVYNNGVGYQLLNDFGNITQFNESGGKLVPFNLNIQGVLGLASGEPSGLWLTCFNPSGEPLSSSGLKLNINSGPPKNDLDLNIRGG